MTAISGRAIWAGALIFGMVTIPVKLYAATEECEGVEFHQVHDGCGGKIRFRRVCQEDGEEVAYSDIAKGLVWGEQTIVFTDADMDELPEALTKVIEVKHFCDWGDIDPLLIEKGYYLAPDGPVKSYALLARVMHEHGVVAVATVALRKRESLAVIRSEGGVLVLTTLRWPEEVRPKFSLGPVEVSDKELYTAGTLVVTMTAEFNPADHTDRYRAAILAIAERKAAKLPAAPKPEHAEPAKQAADLSELLAQALAAAKAKKEAQK